MATEEPLKLMRDLQVTKAGEISRARLLIKVPVLEDGVWRCYWSLELLHPAGLAMTGEDALDAFIRSLRFVSKFIRDSESDGWEVQWQFPGDHGGLPLIEP